MKHIIHLAALLVPFFSYSQDEQWNHLKDAVNVSFTASNIRFAQDELPKVNYQNEWNAVAWRGEKVHTQILVWGNKDISKLTVSLDGLTSEKGNTIERTNIKAGFLRYVITDEFAGGCNDRLSENFDSSSVADPIDPIASVEVKKKNVQPVWLSISVPAAAAPGKYTGFITVNAGKKYKLKISLRVTDQLLPPAAEWKFDLDLWQHPAAIARVHQVEIWSNEHFEKMRPYYTLLAGAGQKCITTSIINEPWGHQTYDDFPSLIKWIKKKNGNWIYDYSLFDRYVSFVMSCGIKSRINCYTMIPWKLSFQYYDENYAKDTVLNANPGSAEYNNHWYLMLVDFTQHLKANGWFDITSISMDERPMKDMQAVIKLVKEIDAGWKITLAGDYHPEIEKDIHDYSVASRWQLDTGVLAQRKADKKPTTFYTCCVEAFPNGFTFSPPDENAWIGWYAAAKNFTGYLRWAYNSWVKDPLKDSRFRSWPAGDTYQVYPGPMTSIRFEKLIEGIQDFEKIRILREQYKNAGKEKELQELENVLQSFQIENLKNTPAAEMIEKAKALLNN
ncbi:MAG: glycoside hydrolase domain-containing protein [Chitinophagaceae bacterium]